MAPSGATMPLNLRVILVLLLAVAGLHVLLALLGQTWDAEGGGAASGGVARSSSGGGDDVRHRIGNGSGWARRRAEEDEDTAVFLAELVRLAETASSEEERGGGAGDSHDNDAGAGGSEAAPLVVAAVWDHHAGIALPAPEHANVGAREAAATERERMHQVRRRTEAALKQSLPSLPLQHALAAMLLADLGRPGWLAGAADSGAGEAAADKHVHVVQSIPWELATVYSAPGAAVPLEIHQPAGGGSSRLNPNVAYLVDRAAPEAHLPRPPGRSAFALDAQPWLRTVRALQGDGVACATMSDYGILLAGLDARPNLFDHFVHHLKTLLVVVHRVWGLDALNTADVVLLDATRSPLLDAYHFESIFREFRPHVVPAAPDGLAAGGTPVPCRCYRHVLVVKPHARWTSAVETGSAEALEGAFVLAWLRQRMLTQFGLERSATAGPATGVEPVRVLYVSRGALARLPHTSDATAAANDTAWFDADAGPVPVRIILNEPELLARLRRDLDARPEVDFQVRSLEGLSPRDQIALLQTTDVLVGPHGAPMTHMLWMRPGSVVLELLPYGFADSRYRNLAHETGKVYLHWQNTDRALSRSLARDVRSGMVYHLCQSNSNYADVAAVSGLFQAALVIASQSGRRAWLPCPDGDVSALAREPRLAPVDCPTLWVGDTCVELAVDGIAGDVDPPLRRRGGPTSAAVVRLRPAAETVGPKLRRPRSDDL